MIKPDLSKYMCRIILRKHAHYAPAAPFARVRLRNFCLKAKDQASLPHDGFLQDNPTLFYAESGTNDVKSEMTKER